MANDMKKGKPMKIEIYNEEDRLKVAAILVRNGYTVRQTKEKRAPNGKSYLYFLIVEKEGEGNDGSQ